MYKLCITQWCNTITIPHQSAHLHRDKTNIIINFLVHAYHINRYIPLTISTDKHKYKYVYIQHCMFSLSVVELLYNHYT